MVKDKDISVYRACVAAGLRKPKDAPSRSEQIAFHWQRSSKNEQERFLRTNWASVAPIVGEIIKSQQAEKKKAQKPNI
jgi:phenylalanyl-tRNA synthetase alpha subunit